MECPRNHVKLQWLHLCVWYFQNQLILKNLHKQECSDCWYYDEWTHNDVKILRLNKFRQTILLFFPLRRMSMFTFTFIYFFINLLIRSIPWKELLNFYYISNQKALLCKNDQISLITLALLMQSKDERHCK